ncbi:MAG TPA: proline racemase family protein [Isosphaeraceae bacterium]|nr:proline racemase family protein [Isosphaeraceae bacterium]
MQSRISVIDTHTGGEPTRVVISGGPELGSGTMAERLAVFRDRFDTFRSAVVNEPRGSDVMVGAILLPPADPDCAAEVIFFNNVGYLGMCGHGTIGVAVALAHLGRIGPGSHRLGTPVGTVTITLEGRNTVAIDNVESYRLAKNVKVTVPGLKTYLGDVAWGGNWFFLVQEHGEELSVANVERLTEVTWRIRLALREQGITGAAGGEIDHIELFGPPSVPCADSKSFVLCPGKAYDRSPCGTGTSAKLACLSADGKLREGEVWRQESIIGSVFEGSVRIVEGHLKPRIRGTAYVNAESTLLIDPADPFAMGIRP